MPAFWPLCGLLVVESQPSVAKGDYTSGSLVLCYLVVFVFIVLYTWLCIFPALFIVVSDSQSIGWRIRVT